MYLCGRKGFYMKNRLYILFLFAAFVVCARAETIVLHTGTRVKGTVIFQNEEVVIIRDEKGARFQYPRTDVQAILADEPDEVKEEIQEEEIGTSKKVSIQLQLSCGPAIQPKETVGAAYDVDLFVGSHHIGNRHIMAGLGVGFHGLFLKPSEKYNFLPIQAALRMPLVEQRHAPTMGLAIGYGVALSKHYVGGVCVDLDFGYRCQLNEKTAIELTYFAQFQQATITVTEEIEGVPFVNKTGRNFVGTGIRFSVLF